MDDIDPDHKILAHQIKLWTDRYACLGEIKGGAVALNYDWLIVTSQYSIDQVFPDGPTRSAIERRFQVIDLDGIEQLPDNLMTKY